MWMFCLVVRSLLPSVAPAPQPSPAIASSLPSAREMPSHHLLKAAQAARRLWHTPPRRTCHQAGAQIPGVVFGSHISLNAFKYIICGHLAAQAKGEASALPRSPAACAHRHTFTHTHVHTLANIYIYTHMYTHMHIYTHNHMHKMCIYAHMLKHNLTYTYIYTHACTHTQTCTHECTHTPIHFPPRPSPGAESYCDWGSQSVQPALIAPLWPVLSRSLPHPGVVLSIITRCPSAHPRASQRQHGRCWLDPSLSWGWSCVWFSGIPGVYPLDGSSAHTPSPRAFWAQSPQLRITGIYNLLFLVLPLSIRDLSSLTRDQTHDPCIGSTESKLPDYQGRSYTIPLIKPLAPGEQGPWYFPFYFLPATRTWLCIPQTPWRYLLEWRHD